IDVPERGAARDIVRAGVESIAHMVMQVLDRARGPGPMLANRLVASGGLVALPYLIEYQSALPEGPIWVSERAEATLDGVAVAAARASGHGARFAPARRLRRIQADAAMRRRARRRHEEWERLLMLAERWGAGRDG